MSPLLEVNGLHVALPSGGQRAYAVENADLRLARNEILCVVGESGSGKSLTARAVMGLLPRPHVRISEGSVNFLGEDLAKASEARLRQIRGSEISMIFQEPMTALNPVMTIGDQIDEVFRFHEKMPSSERRDRALGLLSDVQIPDPEQALKAYPHELSGGQRQRAMIAMALALDPKILIADEPTTALDVTTQAQILKLIKQMQDEHGTGVLFITHDFGVVADIADRVAVMQNGIVVETGTATEVLLRPNHPYTQSLMAAVPSLNPRPARPRSTDMALQVKGLVKTYRSGGGFLGGKARVVHAAKEVTLDLARGETLGIVGESGSGKSTVARCIVRLSDAEAGEILLDGTDLRPLNRSEMRPFRAKIQMVFQDPFASLNPRSRVGRIIEQGPLLMGADA
ncbi:MAG: ATP-binding cassette domain-containing protein, partial [Paracoccaceae bacterium]